MKKIILTLGALLAIVSAGIAEIVPASLESQITAGTFSNEIDDAFSVSPSFGSYENAFVHAGFGNPRIKASMATAESLTNNAFTFGYYMPGTLPMSFFGQLGGTAIFDRPGKNVSNTFDNIQNTTLLTTTTTNYKGIPVFDDSKFTFQYLIGIGNSMATGAYITFDTDYSVGSDPFNNSAFSTVDFVDHQDANKNHSEMHRNILGTPAANSDAYGKQQYTFKLGVPFAFKIGNFSNVATFEIGSTIDNKNGKYAYKSVIDDKSYWVKDTGAKTNLNLSYALSLPAEREDDTWSIGAKLGFDINSHKRSYEWKDGATDTTQSYKAKYTPGFMFNMGVSGARLLTFHSPAKTFTFKMKPSAGFDFSVGQNSASNPKTETNVSVMGITTKTETKEKTQKTINGTINGKFELPMGVRIMPEKWILGFMLGATPHMGFTITTTSTGKKPTEKETIVNGTSTGKTYSTISGTSKSHTIAFNFYESHSIGLTFPFENGAHLDISMNGSSITFLENFKIQAFIPLGK